MASKKIELEVEVGFIGCEAALTAAEEKALSDFFKQRKKAKSLEQPSKTTFKSRSSIHQGEVLA